VTTTTALLLYILCYVGAYICIRMSWWCDGSSWTQRDRLIGMGFSLLGPLVIVTFIGVWIMMGIFYLLSLLPKIDWDKEVTL